MAPHEDILATPVISRYNSLNFSVLRSRGLCNCRTALSTLLSIDIGIVCRLHAGKRACIAQQLARQEFLLFLVCLLQKFYFRPPEGQDAITYKQEAWAETIALPEFYIRMIPRD